MNSTQAKKIPIVDILERLGHQPVRKDKGGVEWVYNSPFRKETEPSLFVNIKKNVWNDFGDRGGNALDFMLRYQGGTVREALLYLDDLFKQKRGFLHISQIVPAKLPEATDGSVLVLDGVKELSNPALLKYISEERKVESLLARCYLKEVDFHNAQNGKKYFALGFENLSGGYEIRNPYFKSSLGAKDISVLKAKSGGREALVFEGFMDFLSYLTDIKKRTLESDVLVLNSISFTAKAKQLIQAQGYSRIFAFLDNDSKGLETLASFQELPLDVTPCNHRYQGFKDYNEWLKNNRGLGRGK